MWESLDVRKFPRLNIECDIEVHEAKTSLHFSTVTQNIGAGGVCVILNRELPRLTPVFLRLRLPDGLPPVECSGKGCWAIRSRFLFKNENQFDTGIEFLDIKPEDGRRIKLLIESRRRDF